jgi:hypothetical protein
VKGATENALLRLFPKAVMIRPGYIQPMHGVKSPSKGTRRAYAIVGTIYPLLRVPLPALGHQHGRARPRDDPRRARRGAKRILEPSDLIALGSTVRS